MASATRRFRQQECKTAASRARYIKPSECAIKYGKELIPFFQNYTGMAQAIRDLPESPEQRLVKICCMLIDLEKGLARRYESYCPESRAILMGIWRAMTDDARNTLCAAPKCSHALDKLGSAPYRGQQNLIEPNMEVMFLLNTD